MLLVPVCTYIAILRYNLYDIDVVINRALVYGALTVLIIGIYAAAVGSFGVLFQTQGNFGVSLLATGVLVYLPLEASGYRSRAPVDGGELVANATGLRTGGGGMDPGKTEARAAAHEKPGPES